MPSIALIIAAYNEELVIEDTIRSAIKAGQKWYDIYVVSDNSSDNTYFLAKSILGAGNVIQVGRSGKSMALKKGIDHFHLAQNYDWIHIADADGGFGKKYFKKIAANLKPDTVAATGYVVSMKGSLYSKFRVYEYTLGMEISRRIQSFFGVIPVIPGPSSMYRSDIVDKLDFNSRTLTEDFDLTLQIHRKKLGRIQFVPTAQVFTQDPLTLRDFYRQVLRWSRGMFQSVIRQNIGMKSQRIDLYLPFQLVQNILAVAVYTIFLPAITLYTGSWEIASFIFIADFMLHLIGVLMVGFFTYRYDILLAVFQMYLLRFLVFFIFTQAFVEVMLLGKFEPSQERLWHKNTRYQINKS